MTHTFISYVRENRKVVDRLCATLRNQGIQVWLDRSEISPGADWKAAIRQAIKNGDFFIACFSKQYMRRETTHMLVELGLAIEILLETKAERTWFIPVLLSKCEVPDLSIGGPRTLRNLHFTKLYGTSWSKGTQDIIRTILNSTSAKFGEPLASRAELERYLRYAAGVELARAQEYLATAYSFRTDDLPAIHESRAEFMRIAIESRAKLMRIAINKMKHLRAVNDVLRGLTNPGTFKPALQVASRVPGGRGAIRPVVSRNATKATIRDFIAIERPSGSDGIYARILATLVRDGLANFERSVRTIMAEGSDHFEALNEIQKGLDRYDPETYLWSMTASAPPATNPTHMELQRRYSGLLDRLYYGYYELGPAGAHSINAARTQMVGSLGSLDAAAAAIAIEGYLVVFDSICDARFSPIDPP
jgi:hypothetical protein